jgi:hypothetical protein
MKVTSTNYTKPEKEHIKVPVYYTHDGDDIIIDEESMLEVFKEEILKVSHFLNGRKKGD